MPNFLEYNPEQAYLLPPSVRDVLGEEHLCFFGSEQEFVGASPFVGFLSMGLFLSHGLRDWRAMFAGIFRDSWSLSGAAGIARRAPASGRRASVTGWNGMPVFEIPSPLTGDSRTGQPALL